MNTIWFGCTTLIFLSIQTQFFIVVDTWTTLRTIFKNKSLFLHIFCQCTDCIQIASNCSRAVPAVCGRVTPSPTQTLHFLSLCPQYKPLTCSPNPPAGCGSLPKHSIIIVGLYRYCLLTAIYYLRLLSAHWRGTQILIYAVKDVFSW